MNRAARSALGAVLMLLPLASAAESCTWRSVQPESELRFAAFYEGEELPGRFETFTVTVKTDGESGAPTVLVVEVQTASANMNDREINAEIKEAEWFSVDVFPSARFDSREIRPTESGYLAVGNLSLKGTDRELELALTWQREESSAELAGSLRMSREDWRIGTGEWSNNASLADRVDLHWRVKLVPAD